jgi:hypothetical protein
VLTNEPRKVRIARGARHDQVAKRCWLLVTLVYVLVSLCAHDARAQRSCPVWLGSPTEWRVAKDRFGDTIPEESKNFPLLVYWGLGCDPHLREAMRLSEEQAKGLREISAKSAKEDQASGLGEIVRQLNLQPTKEKEQLLLNEMRQKQEELAKAARKRIEAVLTPPQLATCRKRSMAAVIESYFCGTEGPDAIGATPGEWEELAKLDTEWRHRMHRLHQDFGAKCVAVFSPEQLKKLWTAIQREKISVEQPPRWKAPLGDEKKQGQTTPTQRAKPQPPCELDTLTLPVYKDLEEAAVRKELGLTADQEKALRAISTKFVAAETGSEASDDVRQRVDALLTPKQLATLKEIHFRGTIVTMTFAPEIVEEVGLTDRQKAALKTLDRNLQRQMWALNCEMNDRFLAVLSPAQLRRIGEEADRGELHPGHVTGSGTLSLP